jgi:hypothetical protein
MGSLSDIFGPLHDIPVKGEDNSGSKECQPFDSAPFDFAQESPGAELNLLLKT